MTKHDPRVPPPFSPSGSGGGSGSSNGTVTVNSDGSFTYTPTNGYIGSDSFQYAVSDGIESTDATVTPTVHAGDTAPVANADSYSMTHDSVLSEDASGGVLANDSDADGDPLTASLASGPSDGTLTLNPDGSFTYTPNAGWTGSDSFQYVANDGQLTSIPATVTITVSDPNPPVANNDSYSVASNSQFTTVDFDVPDANPGVLANDSDADGDLLSASLVSGPSDGTLTFNPDGTFTYTPNSGFVGTDSFTYTASDGIFSSNTATATLSVIAAPVAANDSYTVIHDQTLNVDSSSGVLANDSDTGGDGQPLTATLVSDVSNGTLALGDDGSFTYTPNPGYVGSDSFTYTADDGLIASNTDTVTINVTNQAPVANNDSYSLLHDTSLSVNAVDGVLANDTDADGDSLTANINPDVSNGILIYSGNDGSFTYIPNPGFVGSDSFTYTTSDGIANSNTATVTLTVTSSPPTSQPPVFKPTTYTDYVPQNIGNGSVFQTVTASDPGDTLTYSITAGNDSGVFAINPSTGRISVTDVTKLNYQTTPTYTLTVEASNKEEEDAATPATVNINVQPEDKVIARPDGGTSQNPKYVTTTGTKLEVTVAQGLLANDYSTQGRPLKVDLLATVDPKNGTLNFITSTGSFNYTPNAGFTGTDTFKYKAADGIAESELTTVTIFVNAPVLKGENDFYVFDRTGREAGYAEPNPNQGVLNNDGPNGTWQNYHAVIVKDPQYQDPSVKFVLNDNGTFTYIPVAGWKGEDSFQYRFYELQGGQEVYSQNVITVVISLNGYVYGNPAKAPNGPPSGGVALVGGGIVPTDTQNFLISHSGGGNFVILTYSGMTAGEGSLADSIWNKQANIAGQPATQLASVQTFAIRNFMDGRNQNIINAVQNAAAIFILGGDQSNYYVLWGGLIGGGPNTIVGAINTALGKGATIGGTSAGMAVLGQVTYAALFAPPTGGNLYSQFALAHPSAPWVSDSLRNNFIKTISPALTGIVTETHFQPGDRDSQGRMGRLITFLANMAAGASFPAIQGPHGIAASKSTGVDIDNNGVATIVAAKGVLTPTFAYFVTGGGGAPQLDNKKGLSWQGIDVYRIAVGATFNIKTWQPGVLNRHYTLNVNNGLMAVEGNNDFY